MFFIQVALFQLCKRGLLASFARAEHGSKLVLNNYINKATKYTCSWRLRLGHRGLYDHWIRTNLYFLFLVFVLRYISWQDRLMELVDRLIVRLLIMEFNVNLR